MDCIFCLKGSNSWWEGDLRRNFAQLFLGWLYWECLGHELALVTVLEIFAKVNSTQSPSGFYSGAVLWTSPKCGSFSPRSRYIVLFLLLLFACFFLFVLLSENFLQTWGFNHCLTKKQKTSPNLTCLRISKLNCKTKIWDKHLDKESVYNCWSLFSGDILHLMTFYRESTTPSTLVNARWLS